MFENAKKIMSIITNSEIHKYFHFSLLISGRKTIFPVSSGNRQVFIFFDKQQSRKSVLNNKEKEKGMGVV